MTERARTAIGYDDICLQHDPGDGHPEHPMRLAALQPVISGALEDDHTVALPTRVAGPAELCRVHDALYVDRVRATAGQTIRLDADTVASPQSSEVAQRGAGLLLEAVDSVFDGRADNAFVAIRPPGHHAEPTHAMGFCLFNNIAIAAEHARAQYDLDRIAVVDFDVHHGNGTQSAFWNDDRTLFVSTHQSPHYPGTGGLTELGGVGAKGTTLNLPLRAGHGDRSYGAIYSGLLGRVLEQFAPQLILVSAGLDLMAGDPLGQMAVTGTGVETLVASLKAAAARTAEGRIVCVLEGGYDLTNLRNGTQACLSALAAEADTSLPALDEGKIGDAYDALPLWRQRWTL